MNYSFYKTPSNYNHFIFTPNSFYMPSPQLSLQQCYVDVNNISNVYFYVQNIPFHSFSQQVSSMQPLLTQPNQTNHNLIQYCRNDSILTIEKSMKKKSLNQSQNENIKIQNSQYTIRSQEKESIARLRFIKKNTQSNILNQIFSFLWTPDKSMRYLKNILENKLQLQVFYSLMFNIKSHHKSQINRFYLKQLIQLQRWQNGFKKLKKKIKKIQILDYRQICIAINKLVYFYLREISYCSIMTSKKMNSQFRGLHLSKCREILQYLFPDS